MKFQAALLALTVGSASAFSPRMPSPASTSSILNKNSASMTQAASGLWVPPKMAAGGAERAYGDEYYEGMFVSRFLSLQVFGFPML